MVTEYKGHMNQPHPVGYTSIQEKLESVDPRFVEAGLRRARDRTLAVFDQIRNELREEMTEDDARKLALRISADHGTRKHWHKPYIRFDSGTLLTFNDPLQPENRLKLGDPVYIDLGPAWKDLELGLEYEGDYGDTFVYGGDALNPTAARCAEAARSLFDEARVLWNSQRTSGSEIYAFLRKRAATMGYALVDDVLGHRVSDFPHHRHSKANLAAVDFMPSPSLWVLEVMIQDPAHRCGAFFEDLFA